MELANSKPTANSHHRSGLLVRHLGYSTGRTEMSESTEHRDPLYLFVCYLEWHITGNLAAYQELVAALDDGDCDIRDLSEVLLHRHSPRPDSKVNVEAW